MQFSFVKYQATGNDFLALDNREGQFQGAGTPEQQTFWARACDRHFGVGGDGVLLIGPQQEPNTDFHLLYLNADGLQGSFCGNGSRAAVHYAKELGLFGGNATRFSAADGIHRAELDLQTGYIRSELLIRAEAQQHPTGDWFIHTGSPHVVRFVTDAEGLEVVARGRAIRHAPEYSPGGTNVNFVQVMPDGKLRVRTYERGVEDETLSCGTGVTAASIVHQLTSHCEWPVRVLTKGGELCVYYRDQSYWLEGPAQAVFEGTYLASLV